MIVLLVSIPNLNDSNIKEDIDKDANSIYLSTSGTYTLSNPNGNITSPNILLKIF